MTGLALLCLSVVAVVQEPGFAVEPVAGGLQEACGMAFTPDGRLLVVERRTGRVMVVRDGALAGAWATLPVFQDVGSAGAIGIAVDPDFLNNGFVYVSHSTPLGENAVVRMREVGGVGTQAFLFSPRTPVSFAHNIGPMVFGADGRLYVLNGDGADNAAPPVVANLRGKVWRIETPGGGVPADNPFGGSYVFSSGHRNAFGIAVHPDRGDLYQTENGYLIDDEFNRLLPGRNYGWPTHDGRELVPDPLTEDPLHAFFPQTAPTGCAFAAGPLYPSRFRDGWFVGDWIFGNLNFVDLDANGGVRAVSLFQTLQGRIYAVVDGPDGNLWVLHGDVSPYGADRVSRVVWQHAPRPALAAAAVSTVSVGGSLTLGATATTGDLVLPWLGASRLATGIPTPFGLLFVPIDAPLPGLAVGPDARGYLALPVPNTPSLRGVVLHIQAAAVNAGGASLTNADTFALR